MPNARHSVKAIEPIVVVEEQKETVSVMLNKVMIVKTKGEISGKEYIFRGGGSIVEVDKEDIEGMMRKNVARQSCCGSYSSPYFSIV
jgi:hypothetical protein